MSPPDYYGYGRKAPKPTKRTGTLLRCGRASGWLTPCPPGSASFSTAWAIAWGVIGLIGAAGVAWGLILF